MTKAIDYLGQRFGHLSVLSKLARRDRVGGVFWECVCDCGKRVEVRGVDLKRSKSCGCTKRFRLTTEELGIFKRYYQDEQQVLSPGQALAVSRVWRFLERQVTDNARI